MREDIEKKIWHAFEKDIKKHAETGIPVQHLIGKAPFFGRDFIVNEDVLIPRFDTEVLIEKIIACLEVQEDLSHFTLVDVGTGSGIVAITLILAFQMINVYVSDIADNLLYV